MEGLAFGVECARTSRLELTCAHARMRHVPRLLVQDPSQPHRKPVELTDLSFNLKRLTSKVDRHEGILPASNSFARILVQQDGSHCRPQETWQGLA